MTTYFLFIVLVPINLVKTIINYPLSLENDQNLPFLVFQPSVLVYCRCAQRGLVFLKKKNGSNVHCFLKIMTLHFAFPSQAPQCFQRQGVENALDELMKRILKGT